MTVSLNPGIADSQLHPITAHSHFLSLEDTDTVSSYKDNLRSNLVFVNLVFGRLRYKHSSLWKSASGDVDILKAFERLRPVKLAAVMHISWEHLFATFWFPLPGSVLGLPVCEDY